MGRFCNGEKLDRPILLLSIYVRTYVPLMPISNLFPCPLFRFLSSYRKNSVCCYQLYELSVDSFKPTRILKRCSFVICLIGLIKKLIYNMQIRTVPIDCMYVRTYVVLSLRTQNVRWKGGRKGKKCPFFFPFLAICASTYDFEQALTVLMLRVVTFYTSK